MWVPKFGSKSKTPEQWPLGNDSAGEALAALPPEQSLVAVETRPDAVADVRPSYNPDNYAVRPPAEAEMLSQLRERVAALEVSQKLHDRIPERLTSVEGAIERQGVSIVGHATELSDVGGFHKAIKIALSIIGTILVVLGGVIFFLFGDFVKTSMKMAREYDYCQ